MFNPLESYALADVGEVDVREHAGSGYRHAHLSLHQAAASLRIPTAMLVVPTPAADNSGATHALEHMVLCGSQKYPFRDAFFRMERRSVALHLNAVTNEWLSTFHFCTPSRADFTNLIEFLVDGVFNPLLTDETFASEVVSQQPSNSESFSGVVYNEMKALTAMPGLVLDLAVRSRLYPETAFGYLSGGDPAVIATLQADQVRAFHRCHYNLSNAWLLTSGDIDHLECQRHLDSLLPSKRSTRIGSPTSDETTTPLRHSNDELASVYIPGGLDATVLCWDRGWSADEYAFLEAHLLLDLLVSRPDSLLRQRQAAGTLAAAHFNVVDSQASRIAMRIGFGRKPNDRTPLPDHDQLRNQIAGLQPTQQHLRQALDRLELLYRSGGLRGAGVNSIGRLRRAGEILCASVAQSERRRWFSQIDPMRLLRAQFESPAACRRAFGNLVSIGNPLSLKIVSHATQSSSTESVSVKQAPAAVDTQSTQMPKSRVDQSLPIVDVAQVPDFPDDAVLQRVNTDHTRPELFLVATPEAEASRIQLSSFFELNTDAATNISQIIYRLDYEANQGELRGLVSTRFDIDSWVCGNRDAGVAGGISVSFTGLAQNAQEVLHAFQSLLALDLQAAELPDTAILMARNRSQASRLEGLLRTGHVTAVSAALRQMSGWQCRHYGSGLGLLARDSELSWTPVEGGLADRLRQVVLDVSGEHGTRIESVLTEELMAISGRQNSVSPGSYHEIKHDPTVHARRSLIRVPGSVNYIARVLLTDSTVSSVTATACRLVLAAAARNCHLLDAIRGVGGAYGTGVEVMSGVLALWSYRDPRLSATYADFDTAILKLATQRLDSTALLEAKLCALTQLNKRFLPDYRNTSALITLIEEYDAGHQMSELYAAIKTLSETDIQSCAEALAEAPAIDAALVGRRWHGEEGEFDDFDFRDQSLLHH